MSLENIRLYPDNVKGDSVALRGKMKQKHVLVVIGWICLVILSRYLKFSIPIGEQSAQFSCFTVVLPLIAYFLRLGRSVSLVGGGWFLMHLVHPIPLTAGIPTLFATLSWRASREKGAVHWGMHVLFPLLAMVLFATSSNGSEVWPYALYWLIPVGCAFGRPGLFGRALQSTFVAHAAGSVIWVYLTPVTSAQWLALIPVVAVERLLAVGVAVSVIGVLSMLLASRFSERLLRPLRFFS